DHDRDRRSGAAQPVGGSRLRRESAARYSAAVSGGLGGGGALVGHPRFGNLYREAVQGTAFLSFTNTRVGPGALLSVPMIHKSETGKRSHFITATFQIADAPGADEILIAIGASDGGRAHPRIADRYQ